MFSALLFVSKRIFPPAHNFHLFLSNTWIQAYIKTFWKIESVNKVFLFWYWQRLKKNFFRNKTFLFFNIESWNFQVHFEIYFRETLQNFNSIRQPIKKDENNNCLKKLNVLKFCEDSRILISNWTWKFQLSILKNKKVLFLKKFFFKPLSISKQKKLCLPTQFSRRFWFGLNA